MSGLLIDDVNPTLEALLDELMLKRKEFTEQTGKECSKILLPFHYLKYFKAHQKGGPIYNAFGETYLVFGLYVTFSANQKIQVI
jgi:hypothetical protein